MALRWACRPCRAPSGFPRSVAVALYHALDVIAARRRRGPQAVPGDGVNFHVGATASCGCLSETWMESGVDPALFLAPSCTDSPAMPCPRCSSNAPATQASGLPGGHVLGDSPPPPHCGGGFWIQIGLAVTSGGLDASPSASRPPRMRPPRCTRATGTQASGLAGGASRPLFFGYFDTALLWGCFLDWDRSGGQVGRPRCPFFLKQLCLGVLPVIPCRSCIEGRVAGQWVTPTSGFRSSDPVAPWHASACRSLTGIGMVDDPGVLVTSRFL